MSVDKLVDSTKLDNALDATADAIRAKTGGSAAIAFDLANETGFASAVGDISTGITPTGTKNISITTNGTTTEDVTNYASAAITVNVAGGIQPPTNGWMTTNWDSSGNATEITLYGTGLFNSGWELAIGYFRTASQYATAFTTIEKIKSDASHACSALDSNSITRLTSLQEIELTLGKTFSSYSGAISSNSALTTVKFHLQDDSLFYQSLNASTFSSCSNLATIYCDWYEDDISGAPWGAPANCEIVYLED